MCSVPFFLGEDDDDDECGEEKLPSCFDYVMHFLTVFWKVLFAFVPPTEYWNGWACFIVSIIMIGVLTAFIGDLASHFGCTIGLKDSVTAVVFVALGTSVPGRKYICLMTLSCLTIARSVITNQASERKEPKGINNVTARTLSWHFSRLESWSVSWWWQESIPRGPAWPAWWGQVDLMDRLVDELPNTISPFKRTKQNYRILFKNKISIFYIISKVWMIYMKLCIHWVTKINTYWRPDVMFSWPTY